MQRICATSPHGTNGSSGRPIGGSTKRCTRSTARRVCREAAAECNKPKVASRSRAQRRSRQSRRLARADRRLAATIDQWDADPWLLNTPDGVVDLRTGNIRPHGPIDYMTKITAVGPRGDCPRFLAFLDRITGGDSELVAYLQRVLGYALTGLTREHALFFGYGTGANGKSVLLSTVSGILGDYHSARRSRHSPRQTAIATRPISPAFAAPASSRRRKPRRAGAGPKARIKQLTGGDRYAARFMRQDFFEYRPTFKLFIAGNHKPILRSVDEAIRRRFHLIPFAVTIPPEERDANSPRSSRPNGPASSHG